MDADLKRIYESDGLPPLWDREPGFETLVRIILEQQVSLVSAKAVFERLQRQVAPFTAEQVASLGIQWFREHGVTRQKARYIVLLSQAILDGSLDLEAVGKLEDAGVMAALTSLTGVGPWTAQIYLLMALCRADVWPQGDIALLKSMTQVKNLKEVPDNAEAAAIAENWAPYRSVAARMLWQRYLIQHNRPLE